MIDSRGTMIRRFIASSAAFLIAMSAVPSSAALPLVGPPLYVYATGLNGTASSPNVTQASAFDQNTFGAPAPPAVDLLTSSTAYDGAGMEMTAAGNLPAGMINVACTNFTYTNTTGCVTSSAGSAAAPNEPLVVQSWPFYVGTGASSNVNPGSFTLQDDTDDGAWIAVAPAAFTYAQPGNFGPVTGLTAGTSVLNSVSVRYLGASTGTFAVGTPSACTAAQHLFYQTYQYVELEGGQAYMEYSWQPPGAAALGTPTQAVLWGQLFSNGVALGGGTVALPATAGQAATRLTSDSAGCFGYDYAPAWAGSNTVGNVVATNTTANGGLPLTQPAVAVTMGAATQLTYNFLPVLTLSKTHTGTFVDGSTATYSLVVNNVAGTAPTVNPVVITDTLPAGLTYNAGGTSGTNWACSAAGQVVTCTYSGTALSPGNVAAAIAPALTLGVNVKGPASTVTNSAVATTASQNTTGGAITITSNTATNATALVNAGTVTKTVQNLTEGEAAGGSADTGRPGDVLLYTLTFTNAGSTALSGVVLTDPVPANTTYVAGSAACTTVPAGATCLPTFANGTVSWTFPGSFPGNSSATVSFEATIN